MAVYHSDHREVCAHERDWPFRIANLPEIGGQSMGLCWKDHTSTGKIKQDVDAIIAMLRTSSNDGHSVVGVPIIRGNGRISHTLSHGHAITKKRNL